MIKRLLPSCLFLVFTTLLIGQGAILNRKFTQDVPHFLDRLEIKTGWETPFHSSIKNYALGSISSYACSFADSAYTLSTVDQQNLSGILVDNNEWLINQKQIVEKYHLSYLLRNIQTQTYSFVISEFFGCVQKIAKIKRD